jgi:hypothetical protein
MDRWTSRHTLLWQLMCNASYRPWFKFSKGKYKVISESVLHAFANGEICRCHPPDDPDWFYSNIYVFVFLEKTCEEQGINK